MANCLTKEKFGLQQQRIALLEKRLRSAEAELQARLELTASQGRELAELRTINKELVAELQHTQGWLARIREAARPTPEPEGRARAGASETKRARTPEDRNDTGSSARASKRSKKLSERSGEATSAAKEISGDEVMSEDDD